MSMSAASRLAEFVAFQRGSSRPIVVVTSGGTQVPLEHNMVRFVENFSKGERGALSVEYFLSRGYSVVFLHRKESTLPFTKVFGKLVSTKVNDQLLSRLHITASSDIALAINKNHRDVVMLEAECCKYLRSCEHFLDLEFVTLKEYLSHLEMVATALSPCGPRVCFYLAAAVSDFFIPDEEMSAHKIQSATGLTLELSQVPKLLGTLRNSWAPHALVVSFKLETDPSILLQKAYRAIDNYGVHYVIANLLATRREECTLVSKEIGETGVNLSAEKYAKVPLRRGADPHIEARLVHSIERMHVQHMLREFGVFGDHKTRQEQAVVETQVLRMLTQAMNDEVALVVRRYTQVADALWPELEGWDHTGDPPAVNVELPPPHLHGLIVLGVNVVTSTLVMAAAAWLLARPCGC